MHLGMIVLPKSVTESRIIENFKATELTLTSEEVDRLKGVDRNMRLFKVSAMYFSTEEKLWDTKEDEAYKL